MRGRSSIARAARRRTSIAHGEHQLSIMAVGRARGCRGRGQRGHDGRAQCCAAWAMAMAVGRPPAARSVPTLARRAKPFSVLRSLKRFCTWYDGRKLEMYSASRDALSGGSFTFCERESIWHLIVEKQTPCCLHMPWRPPRAVPLARGVRGRQ